MVQEKIIHNKIKCLKCGDIIESYSRHDFKMCKCGAVGVDGGHDYIRRIGEFEDFKELCEIVEIPTKTRKKYTS